MYIVGMNFSTNADRKRVTTLHVSEPFNEYYSNSEAGRGCIGEKVDKVFVGEYDCSKLELGMEIDIFYDKAVSTRNGTYQPIKRIDILG